MPEVAAPAEPPRVAASQVPIKNSKGFHGVLVEAGLDGFCASALAAQIKTAKIGLVFTALVSDGTIIDCPRWDIVNVLCECFRDS